MPIYAYRCSTCGLDQEVMQKMSDAPLTTCPQCKTETLVKQLTAAGIQLKGSGWYVSDYGGKNPSTDTSEPSKEAAEAAPAKESDKTEATPPPKFK